MKSTHLLKNLLPPKFLVLMGCNVFLLLRPVEKTERKDENSFCALGIQEFGYCEMSVFAMGLSRNISLYDKVLLPGRIGKILTST